MLTFPEKAPHISRLKYVAASLLGSARFVSSFGALESVRDGFSDFLKQVLFLEKWGPGAGTANSTLSMIIAVVSCTGDGVTKSLSELEKFLKVKSVLGEQQNLSKWIVGRSWFLALSNAVTTAASAFNGAANIFYFADKAGRDAIGIILGLLVYTSSSIFNAKLQMENNVAERSSFQTWKYFALYVGMGGISCITNSAFSTFQVLELLNAAFDLEATDPRALAISGGLSILSSLNLYQTGILSSRRECILWEKTYLDRRAAIDSSEMERLVGPSSEVALVSHRRPKQFVYGLILSSFVLGVFNMPANLKDLITTFVGLVDEFMGKKEPATGFSWESSTEMIYTVLLIGLLLAIPGAVINLAARGESAKEKAGTMIDGVFAFKSKWSTKLAPISTGSGGAKESYSMGEGGELEAFPSGAGYCR